VTPPRWIFFFPVVGGFDVDFFEENFWRRRRR
jgi:hypothetical protein